MNRQESFEKAYAEAHDMPLDTFAKYRMGDTYRLPGIAKCWRFWNLALDSVVVELPSTEVFGMYSEEVARVAIDGCADAINDAGINWVRA